MTGLVRLLAAVLDPSGLHFSGGGGVVFVALAVDQRPRDPVDGVGEVSVVVACVTWICTLFLVGLRDLGFVPAH